MMKNKRTNWYLGIDFGTSTSLVAYVDHNDSAALVKLGTEEYVKSVINFKPDGTFNIGKSSGKTFPISEFKMDIANTKKEYSINQEGSTITPVNCTAILLKHLKDFVKKTELGNQKEVVLTVPAIWDIDQCRATELAALSAGFEKVYFIDEPTSALIYYNHALNIRKEEKDQIIMVFDFGGGTLDISIIKVKPDGSLDLHDNKYTLVETLGIAGRGLGGKNIDEALANYFAALFEKEHGIKISAKNPEDRTLWWRLKNCAEQAKKDMIAQYRIDGGSASIEVNEMFLVDDKSLYLEEFNYDTFEAVIAPVLGKILEPVEECIKKAQLTIKQIDKVLLVGGSSLLPVVTDKLEEFFKMECPLIPDPVGAVAKGAALFHRQLNMVPTAGEKEIVVKIAGDPYGLVVMENGKRVNDIFAKSNQKLPFNKKLIYSIAPNADEIIFQFLKGDSRNPEECETLAIRRISFPAFTERTKLEIVLNFNEKKVLEFSPSLVQQDGEILQLRNCIIEGAQITQEEIQYIQEEMSARRTT